MEKSFKVPDGAKLRLLQPPIEDLTYYAVRDEDGRIRRIADELGVPQSMLGDAESAERSSSALTTELCLKSQGRSVHMKGLVDGQPTTVRLPKSLYQRMLSVLETERLQTSQKKAARQFKFNRIRLWASPSRLLKHPPSHLKGMRYAKP